MDTEYKKNSHCSYCGTRFTEQVLWPRRCFRCYNDSWSNPLPVVVVLQVVQGWYEWGGIRYGLLIQKRGIDPHKGEWALTGGYIDNLETWREAAVREVREEIGLPIKEEWLDIFDIQSSTKKDCMLIFCTNQFHLKSLEALDFQPNEEVLELDVMWDERALAFPSHTEVANKYLKFLKEKE